ncbi:hypothetical protein HK405_011944 [Cladochytrium tenue]|nr:hypothetical protein HK405_011944 [Cladochytrium tenue]
MASTPAPDAAAVAKGALDDLMADLLSFEDDTTADTAAQEDSTTPIANAPVAALSSGFNHHASTVTTGQSDLPRSAAAVIAIAPVPAISAANPPRLSSALHAAAVAAAASASSSATSSESLATRSSTAPADALPAPPETGFHISPSSHPTVTPAAVTTAPANPLVLPVVGTASAPSAAGFASSFLMSRIAGPMSEITGGPAAAPRIPSYSSFSQTSQSHVPQSRSGAGGGPSMAAFHRAPATDGIRAHYLHAGSTVPAATVPAHIQQQQLALQQQQLVLQQQLLQLQQQQQVLLLREQQQAHTVSDQQLQQPQQPQQKMSFGLHQQQQHYLQSLQPLTTPPLVEPHQQPQQVRLTRSTHSSPMPPDPLDSVAALSALSLLAMGPRSLSTGGAGRSTPSLIPPPRHDPAASTPSATTLPPLPSISQIAAHPGMLFAVLDGRPARGGLPASRPASAAVVAGSLLDSPTFAKRDSASLDSLSTPPAGAGAGESGALWGARLVAYEAAAATPGALYVFTLPLTPLSIPVGAVRGFGSFYAPVIPAVATPEPGLAPTPAVAVTWDDILGAADDSVATASVSAGLPLLSASDASETWLFRSLSAMRQDSTAAAATATLHSLAPASVPPAAVLLDVRALAGILRDAAAAPRFALPHPITPRPPRSPTPSAAVAGLPRRGSDASVWSFTASGSPSLSQPYHTAAAAAASRASLSASPAFAALAATVSMSPAPSPAPSLTSASFHSLSSAAGAAVGLSIRNTPPPLVPSATPGALAASRHPSAPDTPSPSGGGGGNRDSSETRRLQFQSEYRRYMDELHKSGGSAPGSAGTTPASSRPPSTSLAGASVAPSLPPALPGAFSPRSSATVSATPPPSIGVAAAAAPLLFASFSSTSSAAGSLRSGSDHVATPPPQAPPTIEPPSPTPFAGLFRPSSIDSTRPPSPAPPRGSGGSPTFGGGGLGRRPSVFRALAASLGGTGGANGGLRPSADAGAHVAGGGGGSPSASPQRRKKSLDPAAEAYAALAARTPPQSGPMLGRRRSVDEVTAAASASVTAYKAPSSNGATRRPSLFRRRGSAADGGSGGGGGAFRRRGSADTGSAADSNMGMVADPSAPPVPRLPAALTAGRAPSRNA